MKKRILTLLLAVLLPLTAMADTRIMVATDLHYLAPSLYADSELFQQVIRYGDGKLTQESPALLEALLAGATVITATHQNLLSQTSFSSETYLIRGGERMQAMLAQAGVRLNLSGHIHAQHTMRSGDLTDAATGAYSISPHRWAIVSVARDGAVRYSADALCPEHLRAGFPEMSAKFFASVTVIKLRGRLAEADISPEDQEIMLDYAARFNTHFFAGTLDQADPFWTEDPGYALWNANRDRLSFGDYMMRNLAYEEALRSAP